MRIAGTDVWATVLAGGQGARLAGVTGGVPKQFWAFDDGGTLLEQTLTRIGPLVRPEQTVVVIDCKQASYVENLAMDERTPVVRQVCDRGTTAGVFLGLIPALRSGADPIVLLTPSDHGVVDAVGYRAAVRAALTSVRIHSERIVVFGAQPSGPDAGYGWIAPLPHERLEAQNGLVPVRSFVEKPPAEQAAALLEAGAVWNTMVVVARASALLRLFRRCAPAFAALIGANPGATGSRWQTRVDRLYAALPTSDFCRDLLSHSNRLWVHVWPATLGWSDLGTPERLQAWLSSPVRPGRRCEPPGLPHLPAVAPARSVAVPVEVTP